MLAEVKAEGEDVRGISLPITCYNVFSLINIDGKLLIISKKFHTIYLQVKIPHF